MNGLSRPTTTRHGSEGKGHKDVSIARLRLMPITACLVGLSVLAGCEQIADFTKTDPHRLFSPDQVIAPPSRQPISPILNSVSLVDQTQELPPNATFPTDADLEYTEKDYIIGPTDTVDIFIMDLFQEGQEAPLRREVSDTGFIDLPLLPDNKIKAEGLTKDELTEAIKQAYSPGILRNPTVSVTISGRKQNTFSILGAIARAGTYQVVRRDMRLMEALAMAGGPMERNAPYVYVIRPAPAVRRPEKGAVTGQGTGESALPALPELLPEEPQAPDTPKAKTPAPSAPAQPGASRTPAKATAPAKGDIESALRELGRAMPPGTGATQPQPVPSPTVLPNLSETTNTGGLASADGGEATGRSKWVFRDGRWITVAEPAPTPATASAPAATPTSQTQTAAKPSPASQAQPTLKIELPPVEAAKRLEKPAAPAVAATKPIAPPVAMTKPIEKPVARETKAEEPAVAQGPAPEPLLPREKAASRPSRATSEPNSEDPFGWKHAGKSDLARVIVVNLPSLLNGNASQNIVVHDNDIINIPSLPVGEFYVCGEVNRPGVYLLPSSGMTVKMALTAAGNLSPLAWPENSVLYRRIGNSQEQVVPLNIEAIFQGREPDVFLKPNDVIGVGTDFRSPFYAVFRNAFRMTYGFGFIYDRNFSDPLLVTPTSNRFTRL
ncbi:MAG: SLBB domain-containing protein [Phycisphaerae bacterium]